MKTAWDYSKLARHYDKRADYSADALEKMLEITGASSGGVVADVGAGTGKLTSYLLRAGLEVIAVEPNEEMRKLGIQNTRGGRVTWIEGVGEGTGLPDRSVALVTFGSSFNVCERQAALKEAHRILRPGGWFACLWNHRDLSDPLQAAVEQTIARAIPGYSYGARREDQSQVIAASGLFLATQRIEGRITHRTSVADYMEAWKSHATLARQAGDRFKWVIQSIRRELGTRDTLEVPYLTQVWCAKRK